MQITAGLYELTQIFTHTDSVMTPPINSKRKLLIVEDNKRLAENLFEYLGEDKYELDYAADGLTALHLLASHTYDVIILDIMLPGVNGLTICRRIREDLNSSVPVLMLTARDSIEDKTEAFDNGADDYLIKPFHMKELELRIQALCRRQQANHDCLTAKNIRYYPGTLTVKLPDQSELRLIGYAATIFEALMRKYPDYVNYQHLSTDIWGHPDGDINVIRTHVYVLRKTLKNAYGQDIIQTLHGRGYCLAPA
ncbi:response regulator transcription factor [Amphritea sp. 2_MG-2023]|uniref:response regulator transcription factor n=1 Tax=Amphritea TaxID=515417 RepID=UPI001C07C9B0|nr:MULTISPECIES: response regulator transcription factor [Amphritea]MBU2965988.1 response regulator transcription factor [Amphritea atlantica]MDO6418078.1 response regulator transcription factor [Amphritea sp. 2_MG-2023]